jgi:Gpi18-like mannosyltransferase
LVAVFVVGLVVRAILIPITHGQDFVVWDKASAATLDGVNIYAHHPHYPAGPYSYFPFFVYLELPFQWFAQCTGIPFTVLGKLPIAVGDIVTAWVLAAELNDRGHPPRVVAAGTALFFLNPLVLDNSALYGRFDSLGCALLLLALRGIRRRGGVSGRDAVCFAFAVAAKTFPGFAVLGFLRAGRNARRRVLLALVAVLGALSLPYLGSFGGLPARHSAVQRRQGSAGTVLAAGIPTSHGRAKCPSY